MLTAQKAFLNNSEDIVNCRVDIREDIKRYQDTLSYALSKVDYSMGENIYMLPSNMNLNIRSVTVGYNNKILVSDGNFSLGKNEKVNTLELVKEVDKPKSHEVVVRPTITHKDSQKQTITNEEEKVALILSLAGGFAIWCMFQWDDLLLREKWNLNHANLQFIILIINWLQFDPNKEYCTKPLRKSR